MLESSWTKNHTVAGGPGPVWCLPQAKGRVETQDCLVRILRQIWLLGLHLQVLSVPAARSERRHVELWDHLHHVRDQASHQHGDLRHS